jgi:hypothetical protein
MMVDGSLFIAVVFGSDLAYIPTVLIFSSYNNEVLGY